MSLFILIVGGGKVGSNLARALLAEGYEIALVDDNRQKFASLERTFEHSAILGDGTEMPVLEKAGILRADYVIAVTGDDEDNIIISQLALEKYDVTNVIARVNNPRNQQTFDQLGIHPTVSSVTPILSLIEHSLPRHRLLSLINFEEENISMVEITLPVASPVIGKALKDINLPQGVLLTLIIREHLAIIPHGDIELMGEDDLIVVLEKGRESELFEILGIDPDQAAH